MPQNIPQLLRGKNKNPRAWIRTIGPVDNAFDLTESNSDLVVIFFPHLPEEIDINRVSDWDRNSSPITPDGINIYKSTQALQIPLTFKVHAFDDYSTNGPESILQIAARLHSLTLPQISTKASGSDALKSVERQAGPPPGVSKNENDKEHKTGPGTDNKQDNSPLLSKLPYYQPPACELNLMIGSSGLGIRCTGFVASVSVKLKGPWLSSASSTNPNLPATSSTNLNLPTAAEFNLVFTYAPGYTNSFNSLNLNSVTQQTGFKQMRDFFLNSSWAKPVGQGSLENGIEK